MARDVVNESSAFTLRTRYFSVGQVPGTPATVRYRITDLSNDRIVRDWTELTPSSVIDIEITSQDNDVYDDSSAPFMEQRVVSVQANYDTQTQYADEYRYLVKNLRGFES